MREFNLEEAKAGHPVCTRDGRKARIVCYDMKITIDHFPLLVLVENDGIEQGFAYNEQGHRPYTDGDNDPNDIMMVSVKHEGWVNIYRDTSGITYTGENICDSQEEMEEIGKKSQTYIATVKIEWEE